MQIAVLNTEFDFECIPSGDMLAVSRNASICTDQPFGVFRPFVITTPQTLWYAIVFGSLDFVLEQDVVSAIVAAALHAALSAYFQIEQNRLFIMKLLSGGQSRLPDHWTRRLDSELRWSAEYQAILSMDDATKVEKIVSAFNMDNEDSNSSFSTLFQVELEAAGGNVTLWSVNFTGFRLQRVTETAAKTYLASLWWQVNNTADNLTENISAYMMHDLGQGDLNLSYDPNLTSDELIDPDMGGGNLSRKLTGLFMQAGRVCTMLSILFARSLLRALHITQCDSTAALQQSCLKAICTLSAWLRM